MPAAARVGTNLGGWRWTLGSRRGGSSRCSGCGFSERRHAVPLRPPDRRPRGVTDAPEWRVLSALVALDLSHVLDASIVAGLASPRSYERGVLYLEEGRVAALRASGGRVAATVQGSESYAVELTADGGRLKFECSCPIGLEGVFCKHCVAVALRWLRDDGPSLPTLDDARERLEALAREELVEMLIDHAHEDEALARKLLLLAARPVDGASADLASVFALVDQAFVVHGFVPYREVSGYVRGIDETIDVLDGLLEDGRAGDVVELAEHALAAAERALDNVDDSGGEIGDVIRRLEELHLDACRRARPDRAALAERLFAWELNGAWGVFDRAVEGYAEVLGDQGLARYRELAGEAWADVPQLEPGHESRGSYGARFRITRIMETLAGVSGSLDDQIAVHERDLSSGYRFLQIAELCRSHGDHDAALDWAERGMAAFQDAPDPRLRSFLTNEYRRRGRTAEALEQSLAAFTARPTIETYRELSIDATALGEWTKRREWALAVLGTPEPGSAAIARHPSLRGRGCSELVRVFLWEGDVDAAWRAATEGGCTRDLWLELADRRRSERPEDTLGVYRRHVDEVIAGKNNRAYREAVQLIDETMRALFAECGRSEDFGAYVAEVRATHKPKRNLMKLMGSVTTASVA